MKATYSNLMNSRFFNPAFNSAIFDGPIRIYFAQFHEQLALKIYFSLQQQFPELLARAKTKQRTDRNNTLVMLYPSSEAFHMSFDSNSDFVVEDHLGEDKLIGINGPFEDDRLPEVLARIADVISTMQSRLSNFAEEPELVP